MAASRPRLLTLALGGMETITRMPNSFAELMALAQDWTKPPPEVKLNLRVPVDFVSVHAARLVTSPYIYLTGEDSFKLVVMGVQGARVEICGDAPPIQPPPPPPPPVFKIRGTFDLELIPGRYSALDVTIDSHELDMSRAEDGTLVDGTFIGTLHIVHTRDTHTMEFSGTKLPPGTEYAPDMVDARVMTKMATATKPAIAKCHLIIQSPIVQTCDLDLTFSPFWKMGVAWPLPEKQELNERDGFSTVRYSFLVHPTGELGHPDGGTVSTALYYEAIPNVSMHGNDLINPQNGFAMSLQDFIPHLIFTLDYLGMSLYRRTAFINNNMSAFSSHRNIAYKFLSPSKIAAAIDITVSNPCTFTRIFFIFRGLTDDELSMFTTTKAGAKEASQHDWRGTVGWSEFSNASTEFRVHETSVLEVP